MPATASPPGVPVLLVGDPAALASLADALGPEWQRVATASATEALGLLAAREFAAVVVGVDAAGDDGLALLGDARARPRSRETPFVFVTARPGEFPQLAAYRLGAVDVVAWPVAAEVLRAKLALLADLFQRTQRLRQIERERADAAGRDGQERLALAVAIAQMGTFEIDLVTDAVVVNEPGRAIYGWDDARTTFSRVQSHFHPDDRDEVMRRVAAAFDPEGPGTFEVVQRIVRTDGALRWIRVRGQALFAGEGAARRAVRCLGTYLDITEQRRAEERQRFLADLAAATQPLTDPHEMIATFARLLCEHLGADRCAYAEIDGPDQFVVTGDHVRGVPSIVGRYALADFGAEFARAMLADRPFVVDDVEADPRIEPETRAAYRATGIRAVISAPLHKQGRLAGGLAVHQTTPRRWTDDETELVRTIVVRCWESMQRARAEAERARFVLLAENSPDFIGISDADMIPQYVNQAGLRLVGLDDLEHARATPVLEFFFPEDRAMIAGEFVPRVVRDGAGEVEVRFRHFKTGAPIWVTYGVVCLRDAAGRLTGLATVSRDVSERRRAEEQLRRSHDTFLSLIENAPFGVYVVDAEFRLLQVSAASQPVFSNVRPLIGRDFAEVLRQIWPEPFASAAIERFLHTLRTGEPYHSADTTEQRHDAPQVESYDWTLRRISLPDGRFGVVCYFYDISEHKRAEARIARLLQQEQRHGALLARVAEASRSINAMLSSDGIARLLADEARAVVGARQAVVSLSADEAVRAVSPSDGELAGSAARTLAVPLVGHGGRDLGLVRLSDKIDGEFTEEDASVLGQLAAIASVGLENARLYDSLREQDRRKDEFLATLAHELRNPLAPIRNALHILGLSPETAPPRRMIEVLGRQVAHMTRLLDDLLDVSRVSRGKIELRRQRADLRDIVRAAVETSGPHVERGRHRLTVELPEAAVVVDADPTRLAQAIGNLLHNAAKYTPPGGDISLVAAASGGEALVRVRDTGAGIPPEMLPKVWDLFAQADRTLDRSQGGLGIGLSLVKTLVEMHGGGVEARSAGPGFGSEFTLRLPLAAGPLDAGEATADPPADPPRGLKVLVVEDHPDGAETLRELLELAGHEVTLVGDGLAGLAAARRLRPDVVVCDIGLPGLDGYALARALRADPTTAAARLVSVSGYGQTEDRDRAREAGFDVSLVKPLDPEVLVAALGRGRSV